MNRLFALECHGCKNQIQIPRPTLIEPTSHQSGIPTVERRAVFLCNSCGLVSSYSDAEIRDYQSLEEDPFQCGRYVLCYALPRCDVQGCQAPRAIHVSVEHSRERDSTGAIFARLLVWRTDGTAKCAAEHSLQRTEISQLHPCSSPY